ncbi:DinB family protein [Planococcus sp. YIM B11945]|uniref:DinB family protein n=1 Tax=Planococcus sp. YIM B11945 TaxID=3435410 RepID=UPI003D7EFCFE
MGGTEVLYTLKKDLNNYSPEQLRHIPEEGVWSIGQMYDHIVLVAHEYLDNVEICAAANEEQLLGKTPFGKELFKNKRFPPIKIKLPDEMNSPPNNTDSKEDLINRMEGLIQRLRRQESEVEAISPYYKVEHGGFGWLNAREWFDLVEMHSRHHLRQKEELESYLRKNF